MSTAILLLLCLAQALVAGVFFAFSTFVMKALARLPAPHGVATMQRINVVVLNPLFLGVFIGAALFSLGCAIAGLVLWSAPRADLLMIGSACYLAGSFGVTMLFNVPRNERLARMASESDEASAYWPIYLREWLRWNHVRTVASICSAACTAAAAVI